MGICSVTKEESVGALMNEVSKIVKKIVSGEVVRLGGIGS
jgi:hypothetical protein